MRLLSILSGLNLMAMNLLVGGKPRKTYRTGVAQNLLENFLIKLDDRFAVFRCIDSAPRARG